MSVGSLTRKGACGPAQERVTIVAKHNWLPKSILKQLAIQTKKYVDETLPSSVIFDGKSACPEKGTSTSR